MFMLIWVSFIYVVMVFDVFDVVLQSSIPNVQYRSINLINFDY